jgi:hypothetical protein
MQITTILRGLDAGQARRTWARAFLIDVSSVLLTIAAAVCMCVVVCVCACLWLCVSAFELLSLKKVKIDFGLYYSFLVAGWVNVFVSMRRTRLRFPRLQGEKMVTCQ